MFESLREEEYERIDSKALREKDKVDYILELSKNYWDDFANLLNCSNEISGDELEKRVFDETKKAINSIGEHCRPIGVIIYDKESFKPFGVELGWLNTHAFSKESTSYILSPSEKGFEIYDGLSRISGRLPLREANEKIRQLTFPFMRDEITSP